MYARWSHDEEKMLLRLWAEIFDRLESREARKAWDDIAKKINDKFGTLQLHQLAKLTNVFLQLQQLDKLTYVFCK